MDQITNSMIENLVIELRGRKVLLDSDKAIEINIQIMRVLVGLRDFSHKQEDLERKLKELEAECDSKFKEIFDTLEEVVFPTLPENRELIGIIVPNKKKDSDNV